MSPFLGELVGTAILLTLGNGVVANVILNKTKGNSSGWIVITLGWAIAVFVGVYISANSSGAHLNPAVTIALAISGKFAWQDVPTYFLGQFLGGCISSFLVWVSYIQHFDATNDKQTTLGVYATIPAIKDAKWNFLSECIATFVFVLAILFIAKPASSLGSLDALPVALLVLGIGLSLGGTTGYAINPVRDFAPRFMHAIMPIKGKGDSDWSYAWIPVLGPFVGGALAAVVFGLL
ncbi:MAG: MIP/aquaporin family protein [Chitinophagaceae bacterium]